MRQSPRRRAAARHCPIATDEARRLHFIACGMVFLRRHSASFRSVSLCCLQLLREVNRQPSTDSPRKMRSRSTFRDGTPCLATQPRRRCRTAPLRLAQLGRSNSRESAACQRRACMRVNWLIADRLQARSGSHDSPVTIVEPRRPALEGQRVSPPAKQPAMVEREAMQALGGERSSVEALLRDLAAARKEAEAAREEERAAHQAARDASILHRRHLAAERQRAAKLTQELTAARVDLETMKTQLKQETNAAHDWKAAVAMIKAAREAAARERSERAALEEELRAARREIEAARNGAQMVASEREEPLRHDMVPATGALDTMGVAADGAGAQARKAADTMAERESALEQQRQRAEGLARDLTVLRRDMDSLQAKVAGAIRSKAAALRARRAGEAALVDAKRALVEERQKIGVYARDLALALQSAAALESRAKLAAAEQAAAAQARKIAEAAAKRAGEALALELEAGKSLARELDTARRERDAAKEELTQVLAQHTSLKGERARANGRELSAARQQHDGKKARTERRVEDVDEPKTRAGNHASERAKTARATGTRSVREPGARKGRTLETRKPLKIALPNALLPKRWLAPGLW